MNNAFLTHFQRRSVIEREWWSVEPKRAGPEGIADHD